MTSNFIEWTNEDVINWIRHEVKLLNINYDLIKSHEINGRDLIDLTEENIREDLNIIKLHDRKHLMRKICELMRNLAENNEACDENSEIVSLNDNDEKNRIHSEHKSEIISAEVETYTINNSEYLMKLFKIKFGDKTITMKCANNLKVEHVIKECLDVLNLNLRVLDSTMNNINTRISSKEKIENSGTSPKQSYNTILTYDINDFYLSDKNKIIFPKENFVCDILQEYAAVKSNRKESFMFYLHLNNKNKYMGIKNSNSINLNNITSNTSTSLTNNSTTNTNTNFNKNSKKPVKIFDSADTNINKEISTNSISNNSHSISNIYKQVQIPHKNNYNNRSSNDISIDRTKYDNYNYYKDFSITETAVKNRFVSFEALDNLEKNGYSFINKKLNSHLNKTNEEKVTINSFYNISNLNNFNEKSLNSSNEMNKRAAGNICLISSSHKKSNVNAKGNIVKSNKKKSIISLLNYNSKKLDFDDLSDKEEKKPAIRIESNKEKKFSKGKIELDEYMKMLSNRTCLNTSNESERKKSNKGKKEKADQKELSDNKPISFRNIIHQKNKETNKSSEAEIENFLKSIKTTNRYNQFVTHNSHQINTPNLYNHNESTQSRINPFNNYTITNNTNPLYSNRLYENKSKIISNKIKMRKLIFDNIATKGGKEKNLDSSISD